MKTAAAIRRILAARTSAPNLSAFAENDAERALLRDRYDYVRAWVRAELAAARRDGWTGRLVVSDEKRAEIARALRLEERIFAAL